MLHRKCWQFGIAVLVLLFATVDLQAQLNRGSLEGTVTDAQSAVIPGVEVTVTSVERNETQVVKTNSAGYYRLEALIPGKYRAHFVSQGFSALDITNIEIPAGQVIRQDAALKVGEMLQQVEVSAAPALVETAASNFSTTIGGSTVEEIPLQGRDLQQLVFLFPGVNSSAGPPGSNFGFNSSFGSFPDPTHAVGSDLSVNGGQGGANAWYLDGNLNLSGLMENMAVDPSPDAVSEFQVIGEAFSAEYGRTGGAAFNVVLKSGTNKLHGNIYEYARNDATNARNPFTSIDSQGNIIKSRQLRFNDFGGTLGGPVTIPHIYNGKDRTFFFFSYDRTILHLIGQGVYTVPSQLMRAGDFSEDPNTAQYGLWDPFTTAGPNNATGLYDRTAFGTPAAGFPNGCAASIINANPGVSTCTFASQLPNNRLDSVAMFYMNSFPLPNYVDPLNPQCMSNGHQICSNYLGTTGSSQNPANMSVKIDHQWSDKSKMFGEWLYNPTDYANYRVPWTGATFPWGSTGWGGTYDFNLINQIIAVGNTYTISPTFVNDFRASFSRQAMTTHPMHPYPDSITNQTATQQELAPTQIPEDPYFPVPNITVSSPNGGYMNWGPPNWANMINGAEAYTILDNVTKIIGKHTMKTGFVYRLEHSWYESGYGTNFSFWGDNNTDPISGAAGGGGLEQFLLGAVGSNGRDGDGGLMVSPRERNRYWGFYWQDDFRVTPKLTLDIGLRYELYGMFKTNAHPMSNFCLDCANSVTGLPGKLVYEGDPALPKGHDFFPANKTDFAPRINFAWTPFADHKTVIRGGYDIFYSNAFQGVISPGQAPSNLPGWEMEYDWNGSWLPAQCTTFTGGCVSFPLDDTTADKSSLTTPPRASGFPALHRDPLLGVGYLQFLSPVHADPRVQMWSFQVERELPKNFMVSVGYVGNHGTHLMGNSFHQFNYIHTADVLKYRTGINASVPISQFFSGTTAAELASVYGATGSDPVLPISLMDRPYPFYGAISGVLQNAASMDGATIYHGMNLKIQKRLSQGLDFTAAYTVSKKINNAMTAQMGWSAVDAIHFARSGGFGGRTGVQGGLGGSSIQDLDNMKVDRAIASDDIPQILNIAASYQMPFGQGKKFLNQKGPLNQVFGGWKLTGNLNAQSGIPLGISCPGNNLTSRCDLIGNPGFSGSRSKADKINDWINPAAFAPPFGTDQSVWGGNYDQTADYAWQWGTMGPRLANYRAPGFWNIDSSLGKQFHVTESAYFDFRWEVYNALNHQNLALPNTSFCLPLAEGAEPDRVHSAGCSFGRITNIQTDPRSLQFALKFYW